MKKFAALLGIIFLVSSTITPAEACTSFLLKTKDGSTVYGRTLEWGMFDLKSSLVMVPRNLSNVSDLGGGRKGIVWKNKYGYIAINALALPL
ncbi:MAG: linear amide C-N hydrolase, partial [Candidatus Omnitrophica bacterium]|nr:linear amide C-N hydrolase [Candidatus Omnitrophota bacterium]